MLCYVIVVCIIESIQIGNRWDSEKILDVHCGVHAHANAKRGKILF